MSKMIYSIRDDILLDGDWFKVTVTSTVPRSTRLAAKTEETKDRVQNIQEPASFAPTFILM